MAEYEVYLRYPKEDVLDKEGEEIKLIIRDKEAYIHRPVTARIYKTWSEGMDKLWVLDPLGRPYWDKPAGMKIIRLEDEEKLVDREFHKAGIRV
jgi:hypothetical protein